jgi:uncharacterized protein involved in exopolysaccharide biosynthesis
MTRLETIKNRALQRLSSPPELLYAFTRHWLLIIGLAAFGTLVMTGKVSTDTPLYEAKATMSLHADQSIVVGHGGSTEGKDSERLLMSRVSLLSSETVIRTLVQHLKPPNLLAQDENPEEPSYGPVRKFVSQIKKEINEFLTYLEHPQTRDYGEEREIQRAVSAFRRRSEVVPNTRTGTVQLRVYGTNRELLLRELDQWIEAFRVRLVELPRETRDYYLDSRMRHWREMEASAQRDIDDFRRANPDVSKEAQNLLVQETLRLQLRKENLERQLEGGGVPLEARASTEPSNPEVEDLLSQKRQLEADRRKLLPHFPPESDRLRSVNENIRLVEEKLREVLGLSPERVEREKPTLAEQITALTNAINQAVQQQSALASRLDVLHNLEEEHQLARRTRMSYEVMGHEELDRRESTKLMDAQVIEKPQASWLPFETYPYRQILYGGIAGLGAGASLALLLELFRRTVRLRSDVETEFPVRVIGVIPLR